MEERTEASGRIWGIGLCYEYDYAYRQISIIHRQHYRPIKEITVSINEHDDLVRLIDLIEKTTQIQALMLSNNATCDISEVIGKNRMGSYLEHVIELARATLRLDQGRYEDFATDLCATFDLNTLIIENLNKGYSSNDFFKIRLQTKRKNEIKYEGFNLPHCLSALSQKIISDLLVLETSNNFQAEAHRLLKLSSDLSMLSLVLDEQFIPRRKVRATPQKQYEKSA